MRVCDGERTNQDAFLPPENGGVTCPFSDALDSNTVNKNGSCSALSFVGLFGEIDGEDAVFVFEFFKRAEEFGQVMRPAGHPWLPLEPGFLDLFSGVKGVATWLREFTQSWVITFELEDGPEQDLDAEDLRCDLARLIALGVFRAWGGGPVCKSFSRAICPAVRSRDVPEGLPEARPSMIDKINQGNSCSLWLSQLAELSLLLNIFFWIENPDGSFFFLQKEWVALFAKWGGESGELGMWRLDYCRFGTPWRKRTRIIGNSVLQNCCTFCTRDHVHTPLRGRSRVHRKSWTLVAQPYPKGVAKTIAGGIATSTGFLVERLGGFDPSSFAFCAWRRIGEAKNPGPRGDRTLNLDEIKLVETKTLELQGKIWRWFINWTQESLSEEAVDSLTRNPMLLSLLVKEFGCFLFKEGKPLYILRHLVVLISKQVFGIKPYLTPCWEVLSKWEELEPVIHRTPLPLAVLRAMIVVALHWNWNRFAGCLAISFFGITRPGEVLRAFRSELSLPSDRLMTGSAPVFLKIREPKSRRRGGARIQHASILDELVVSFLEVLFKKLDRKLLLYPISPSSFRRRWDCILEFLGIETQAHAWFPPCRRSYR